MSGAIFLDRDGVLCETRSTYVKSWREFRWLHGAREALRILARLDVPVVLVTNQSAINRGITNMPLGDDMADVQAGLERKFRVVLVRTGLGEQTIARLDGDAQRVDTVRDVLEAARLIQADVRPGPTRHAWPWHRPPAHQ